MMVYRVTRTGVASVIGNDHASRFRASTVGLPAQPQPDVVPALSAPRFPRSGIPANMAIETASGPAAAGEIVAGTRVRALVGGWRTVRAVVTVRHTLAPGDATPVLLRAAVLGDGPARDVTVPAAQRVVVDTPRAAQVAGSPRAAVRAADLGHLSDVRALALATADFVQVLLDDVDAVLAEGLWFETFHPCPDALAALGPAGCRAVLAAAPRLAHRSGQAQYVAPWPVLSAREAEEVI